MARKFNELRRKMSPDRRRRNKDDAVRELLVMNLQELRQSIGDLSQVDVAAALEVTQGYISKLERQDDMLVSKLYEYVEALGGQVEIRACFPNQAEVHINQFGEMSKLDKALGARAKKKSA